MKTPWSAFAFIAICAGGSLSMGQPLPDGPEIRIVGTQAEGTLVWTAPYTTGTYAIEWSSDPTTGVWTDDYSSMCEIPALGGTQAADLPVFFRVAHRQHATDLSATATLDVFSLTPRLLEVTATETDGPWAAVPPGLQGAGIYWDGPYTGFCDFTVLKSGLVYLACQYGGDGGSEGDWDEKRWLESDFLANGWEKVEAGALRCHTGLEFQILAKHCTARERYVLRCNKYRPPHPIVSFSHTSPIAKSGSAVLSVTNSTVRILGESLPDSDNPWAIVPQGMLGGHIYSPQSHNGIAEFTVVQSGRVYVACDFSHSEERYKEAFLKGGWTLVEGLEIVRNNAKRYEIFIKPVSAGEHYRLQSSLFETPHILLYGP